jgi:hypothetical protein
MFIPSGMLARPIPGAPSSPKSAPKDRPKPSISVPSYSSANNLKSEPIKVLVRSNKILESSICVENYDRAYMIDDMFRKMRQK